jgi:hypothetical protein
MKCHIDICDLFVWRAINVTTLPGFILMKRIFRVVATSLSLLAVSPAWSQNASDVSAQPSDAIVQMHNEIRAADRIYDKKVAAAKKIYKQKVAQARAERDKAISAARTAGN